MKNIFIRLFLLLSVCLCSNNVFAARATPNMLTKTQSDGTVLDFYLRGDEHFKFRETVDGYELIENENNDLVYAFRSPDGVVSPSNQLAHNPEDRTAEEIAFLASINDVEVRQMYRQQRAISPRRNIRQSASAPITTGTVRVPVLLIEFANVPFTTVNAQAAFDRQLNQAGYSENGHNGSMRDYFLENSFNQFSPHFDVINPVRVSHERAYYGQNRLGNGLDKRPGTMIAEALVLASAGGFDFSRYDTNNDRFIDFLFVIFAGHNEEDGNDSNFIWSHASDMVWAAEIDEGFINPMVNGVYGKDYFCTSELMGKSNTIKRAGIGTMCHEFSHTLGLPDLYDVDYDRNGQAPGFGVWALMDSGNRVNDGRTPPYLNAFERELLDWGTVSVLTNPDTYSLEHIKSGAIYRINTPRDYEYFLLENRQLNGWDKHLPGSGMLITRVYKGGYWEDYLEYNTINNVAGQERVNLLEANGVYYTGIPPRHTYHSVASDAFPGTANITLFNDEIREPVILNTGGRYETPANSLLWNGETLNKPVLNIRECNGRILFDFLEAQNNTDDTECTVPGIPEEEPPFDFFRLDNNILIVDAKIDLEQILVYNPQGQLLQRKAGQRGKNILQLPGKGVYLIKLDRKTVKIAM